MSIQNKFVKYSVIFLILFVYLNRMIFVTPIEVKNDGGDELNSVIELIIQLATGKCNDHDEDGDLQPDCSVVSNFSNYLPQENSHEILFAKDNPKNRFPANENLILNDFRSQLEQPPEPMINA